MNAVTILRVDQVGAVFNGKTPSKSQQRDSGHPVLKIKDVDALGKFRGVYSGHVDKELANKHIKQQLVGGETLILNAAHSATHVASKTFFSDSAVAGSLATGEWLIIRWNDEIVHPGYGNHWINAGETRFRLSRLVNGIHLYPKDVSRLQIPVPLLPEQKRIAAILDKADELRAKRREAIAELDKLVQATFLDMFGDPVTNPKGFDVTTLDAVTVGKYGIKAGPFGSALKKEFYTSSGYRVYGQEQVIAGTLNEGDYYIDSARFQSLRSCEVRSGDVLVSLVGSFGKTLIVPEKFQPGIINPRLLKITFDQSKVIPEFFQTFFRSDPVQNALASKAHGGTMPILNAGILKALNIPLPPIDQQVRFSNVLETIESKRLLLLSYQLDLENLFNSLQHRAFNGDL